MSFDKAMKKHLEMKKTQENYQGSEDEEGSTYWTDLDKCPGYTTEVDGTTYKLLDYAKALGGYPVPMTDEFLKGFREWAMTRFNGSNYGKEQGSGPGDAGPKGDLGGMNEPYSFRDWLRIYKNLEYKHGNLSLMDEFRTWVEIQRKKDKDMVNHPEHYTSGGIETLDFIREKLNSNTSIGNYQAYCFGNAMKYISRAGLKGDIKEDIKKAIFYLRSSIGDDPR